MARAVRGGDKTHGCGTRRKKRKGRKGVNNWDEAPQGRGRAVVLFSTTVAGIEESVVRNVKGIWQVGQSYCVKQKGGTNKEPCQVGEVAKPLDSYEKWLHGER